MPLYTHTTVGILKTITLTGDLSDALGDVLTAIGFDAAQHNLNIIGEGHIWHNFVWDKSLEPSSMHIENITFLSTLDAYCLRTNNIKLTMKDVVIDGYSGGEGRWLEKVGGALRLQNGDYTGLGHSAANPTLKNVRVRNCLRGIRPQDCKGLYALDCHIEKGEGAGYAISDNGFYFAPGSAGGCQDCTFDSCTAELVGQAAFQSIGGMRNKYLNCSMDGSLGAAASIYGPLGDITFEKCTFVNANYKQTPEVTPFQGGVDNFNDAAIGLSGYDQASDAKVIVKECTFVNGQGRVSHHSNAHGKLIFIDNTIDLAGFPDGMGSVPTPTDLVLTGANPAQSPRLTAFVDPGATSSDPMLLVSVEGSVDHTTIGSYTLTYAVSSGNAGVDILQKTRTVKIIHIVQRDDGIALLASDGFSIQLKSLSKNMAKIRYSQVGVLDGFTQEIASGFSHSLKSLTNKEYFINVEFTDATSETQNIWPTIVPSPPTFKIDYVAPTEGSPYDGADQINSSPIVGGDEKLIIRKDSIESALRLGDRPADDSSVAVMAVTSFDVFLSDGSSLLVKSITAAELAAGDIEIPAPNYVEYEGTVLAYSALGQSLASESFIAKATNYMNKADPVVAISQTAATWSSGLPVLSGIDRKTTLAIRIPYPADILSHLTDDSMIQGENTDELSDSYYGKHLLVRVYDANDQEKSCYYYDHEKSTTRYSKGVLVRLADYTAMPDGFEVRVAGLQLGEVCQFKVSWENKFGEGPKSDASEKFLNMDPSAWVPKTLTAMKLYADNANYPVLIESDKARHESADSILDSSIFRTTIDLRRPEGFTMMSKGLDTSLVLDAASGVPIYWPDGNSKQWEKTFWYYETHYRSSKNNGYFPNADVEQYMRAAATIVSEASVVDGVFTPGVAKIRVSAKEQIPWERSWFDNNYIKWRFPDDETVLTDRFVDLLGVPSAQEDVEWTKNTSNNYVTTERPAEVIQEFSENGGELVVSMRGHKQTAYGLSASAKATIAGQEFEVENIYEDQQFTLEGLTNGQQYDDLTIRVTRDYTLSLGEGSATDLIDIAGIDQKSDVVRNRYFGIIDGNDRTTYIRKGDAAIAADDHSDVYISPSPFTSPSPLTGITLSSPADESITLDFILAAENASGRPLQKVLGMIMKKHDSDLAGADDVVTAREYDDLNVTSHVITVSNQNGSNLFAKLQVQNNSSTAKSAYVVSGIIVPFGNPTLSVSTNHQIVTATIELNGRQTESMYVFAIDPNPGPGETFLLQSSPDLPAIGVLGERLGQVNKATIVRHFDFSTFSHAVSKYFVLPTFEAGSVEPATNL